MVLARPSAWPISGMASTATVSTREASTLRKDELSMKGRVRIASVTFCVIALSEPFQSPSGVWATWAPPDSMSDAVRELLHGEAPMSVRKQMVDRLVQRI